MIWSDRTAPAGTPPSANGDRVAETQDGPLPLASDLQRRRLGLVVLAVAVLAVFLCAAAAPPPVRTPFVLVAASLLPGYPLVARFAVDLPTLVALDVVVSLALEAALAFVMVQASFWHPAGAALAVAAVGVPAVLLTVNSLAEPA